MISNREYFERCCDRERLPQINRYAQRALNKRVSVNAPIWEKEKVYEEWLDEEFDVRKFEAAKLDRHGHAIPENYYYEVKCR